MGWYQKIYGREGLGIDKDTPPPTGLRLLFSTFGREWKTLIRLNLTFLLHALPVVTLPAAICAMKEITLKMLRDEPLLLWMDYRIAFRSGWKRISLIGWIYLLSAVFPMIGLSVYAQFFDLLSPLFFIPYGVCTVVLLLWALMWPYLWALTARSDMPPGRVLKNALLMGCVCFPHSFPTLAVNGGLFLLMDHFLLLSWPVAVLIMFAVQSLIGSFSAWPDICARADVIYTNGGTFQ